MAKPQRSITEPPTNQVLLGPREAFVENLDTNWALLTKRLPNADFVATTVTIGKYTQTQVRLAYLKSVADPQLVATVLKRLQQIDVDGIIDASYISECLNPDPLAFYKAAASEEKPDVVVSRILEGRLAILVDGSPVVLTLPHLFLENIQNSNDYYGGNAGVTLKRVLRLLGGLVAVFLPGFYLALALYHLPLLPLQSITALQNCTGDSLFPPIIEMLLVVLLFEIIYEATLLMPKHLGASIGIVAVLVVGEVASTVGLLSAPTVLVVAIAGVTMYIIPNMIAQISILRLVFTVLGGFLGLYGLVAGGVALLIYTAGVTHYGTPYLAPFAPYVAADQKDALNKVPFPEMLTRPQSFPNRNRRRQKPWRSQ